MQYLYSDDMYHFMNTENYDQIDMSADQVGDSLKFVKENEITETEPGFKGDTAQGANKPAIVETGAQVNVPLFVETGDKISIDTRTGEYLKRV